MLFLMRQPCHDRERIGRFLLCNIEETQLSIATAPQNILYPEERDARDSEVYVNGRRRGYVPLYPLSIIIALSYQLDSMEAYFFRKYICQELQRPASVMEQIFLYGSGSINWYAFLFHRYYLTT